MVIKNSEFMEAIGEDEVVEISAGCFFDDHLLHSNFRIPFLWEEIKIMKITCKEVAQKLIDYLHHRITLADLVDWAEDAMMEANFEERNSEILRDIVARLGLADLRAFGMSWEDCEDYLAKLGYRAKIDITEKEATA